jgi:phage-related protein
LNTLPRIKFCCVESFYAPKSAIAPSAKTLRLSIKNICSIYRNYCIFVNAKFFKSFEKVESSHKGSWFKHLKDEIWEFRERDSSKYYRIFAFSDSALGNQTLIVGTHGLDKKTNKTSRHEIEKAKRSMNKYFEQKKKDKI